MVRKIEYRVLVILLISTLSIASSYCQKTPNDSLPTRTYEKPSIILQLLGGSVAYAIPFWSINGNNYIKSGEVTDAGGVFLGIIANGVAITLIGNLTCNCDGSYLAGIGGSYLGALIAGPIYGGALYDSKSTLLKYLALSIPPVLSSIALYHFTLDETDYNFTTHKISLFPYLSQYHEGLSLQIRF